MNIIFKQKYKNYLNSPEWAQIRNDLFFVRGKKCERCGSKNKLHIHHKSYKNIFNEEPNDLEILCKICHKKEHFKNKNEISSKQSLLRKLRNNRRKKKRRDCKKINKNRFIIKH